MRKVHCHERGFCISTQFFFSTKVGSSLLRFILAKGTDAKQMSAGKEDPVEFDSSLTLCMRDVVIGGRLQQ